MAKAPDKRARHFAIIVAVSFGCWGFMEGCGDRAPVRDSIEPLFSRSDAPADGDGGRRDFASYCLACHGSDGQGTDSGPPLSGSPWVLGPPSRLIRILLHGVRGPIDVGGGITYNREMPAVGPILADARIADLATFVRQRFGDSTQAIAAETVAQIRFATRDRKSYWTAEELLAESR
jgi:mono/diheme cytochrome c family protein